MTPFYVKRPLLIKTFLLLCALIAGSGTMWATDVVCYTLTPETNSASASSSYADSYDFTINTITWNVTGNTSTDPWRIGGKKSTINSSTGTGDRALYSKGTISDNVTKIVISHGNSGSDITVNSVTLIVSTAQNGGGTVISTLTGSYTNNKTTTFNRPNDKDWTGRYYKIVYNVTNTSTTNKFVLFSGAEFYTTGYSLTYSATNGSIAGEDEEDNTVESGASMKAGATVELTATPTSGYAFSSWEVSGTGATLSSVSDNPTTFTMGTANATVTANFVSTSTPSITVSSSSIAKTADEADGTITVSYNNITDVIAEVLLVEDDGETAASYDWLAAEINEDNNIYFTIAENTAGARTAYLKVHAYDDELNDIYSPLITITQAAITVDAPSIGTAAGAVTAGTTVTLTQAAADQIRYTTDGTDPTISTGNVYSTPIAITTPTTIKAIAVKNGVASEVASAAYTISVATPECNLASEGYYLEGTGLTLTSAGNTVYYNMTINGDAPGNPTSSSTEYTGPISLSNGTVKIKAIAYDAYGNTSTVVTRTLYGKAPATLPFSWAGGVKNDLMALTGIYGKGLGSDYAAEHNPYRVCFNSDDDYIEIFTDEEPVKVSVDVKMIGGGSTSKIKVQESTNGIEFSDVEELTISGSTGDVVELETSEEFASTTRVVKLLFVKGSNVGVGPIAISANTTTVSLASACTDGEKYYGTYSNSSAFRVPADLTVSCVGITDGKLAVTNYSTGDVVKGNTGVMLSSTTSGSHTITLSSQTGTEKDGNLLKAASSAVSASAMSTAAPGCLYYRLTMHNGTDIGFWWGAADGAAFDIAANKAYLAVPTAAARNGLWFGDDETTGINSVNGSEVKVNGYYNLKGQRVDKPTKGLYIVNGRKMVVK